MKICSYCGRENSDNAAQCSGCGLETLDTTQSPGTQKAGEHDWVFLTIRHREPDAEQLQSKLKSADIDAQIPDIVEMKNADSTYNDFMIEAGMAWVYVHLKDYPAAKKLLPEPDDEFASSRTGPFPNAAKRVIISSEPSHTRPVLELVKMAGIPVEGKTTVEESGLETSELLVEEKDYDRACDVVEAWSNEKQARLKKGRKLSCPKCGSENCRPTAHIRLESVNQCKDCGFEFLN